MSETQHLLGVICDSVCSVNKADASTKQEHPRDKRFPLFSWNLQLYVLARRSYYSFEIFGIKRVWRDDFDHPLGQINFPFSLIILPQSPGNHTLICL